MLTSTVIAGRPNEIELWLADRGPTAMAGGDLTEQLVRRMAQLEVPCHFTRSGEDTARFISAVGAEVGRRRELPDEELERAPTVLLVVLEPERVPILGRVPTTNGVTDSPAGLELRYVLMQGPAVGVHVVLAASSMSTLRTVIADSVVHQEFRHRIVTRVAEEDSFALVRSSRGSTLVGGNGRASAALLFDSHTQASTTFTPYTAANGDDRRGGLGAQVTELLDRMTEQLHA